MSNIKCTHNTVEVMWSDIPDLHYIKINGKGLIINTKYKKEVMHINTHDQLYSLTHQDAQVLAEADRRRDLLPY